MQSFDQARETLKWGEEALSEYKQISDAFFQKGVYKKVTEIDPENELKVVKLVPAKEFPINRAARKVTEAILNVKNAFDQATHACCSAIDPKAPAETAYFPWTDTPSGLEKRLSGKSQKIPDCFHDDFRKLEPFGAGRGYQGGDTTVRSLAKIANRKHTVGIAISPEVTFSDSMFNGTVSGEFEWPEPNWDPETGDIVLYRISPGNNEKFDFRIFVGVAFDDTTPMFRKPVYESVLSFTSKANRTIDLLAAAAARERRC